LKDISTISGFEQVILPHLKAAYNLARYLCGDDDDASDLVQDACLKAFRFYDGFHGENGRAWFFTIIRNTFYTEIRQKKKRGVETVFDEEFHDTESDKADPETLFLKSENVKLVKDMLEQLPLEFREIIILREMEGFSYKEIAGIAGIPVGTVMSRLARARKELRKLFVNNKFVEE
jgi:RNA polymerase sigma factor (sigma-70 family)